MKTLYYKLILFFLVAITFRCYAQVETKRWWNLGATTDTDRAVFCADSEILPANELLLTLHNTQEEAAKLQIFIRIIRAYQEETLIYRAIQYADSAMSIAVKLKDSLSICRIHVASVFNMDMCGNPGGMLEQTELAKIWMPHFARGTVEEFKVYAVTGDAYFRLIRYEEAEQAYQKARSIIELFGNEKCKGYVCMSLGKVMQNSGKIDKAIDSYLEGVSIFESFGDTLSCCILYSQIAGAYSSLGLRDKQLEYLYKTLALSEKLGDPLQQAAIYRDLGLFYREHNDSILTTDFYQKAIASYRKVPQAFSPTLGDSYNDMADFYYYMGDQEKSLENQRLSIKSYWAYPRPVTLMTYKMGNLYFKYGQLDSAFYYFSDAYNRSLALSDPRLSATCCKGFANYYTEIGNISKAIFYAEKAYKNAQDICWLELVCDISGMLSKLYAQAHNFQQAYFFQMRYDELSDSMQMAENLREVARLSAQMEFAEREAQMHKQIEDQKKWMRIQWGITTLLGCVLILGCVLVIVILRNSKQRRAVNLQLSDQKEELIMVNEELTATNEELMTVNEELQRTYDELDHYKNDLEQMVNEKTAELQLAFTQVQESDRFKAAFFANMSHEIRTPLNAILGFLQFIFTSDIDASRQNQMISMINANAAQLLWLVDDIVDLSKIDSGLLSIRPKKTSIEQLLDETYTDAEQIIQYTNKTKLALTLENHLPLSHDMLLVDADRIKQVLLHLLHNAIKFTPVGFITFGCEIFTDKQYLQFFVEDTGIGIPQECKSEIFKRFWKHGDIYTQQYRGVGIGLSLCQALVELMDGDFYVESTVGKGTVLRFTVKIQNADIQ